jgi:5-hydroxyisourate hydrolase
VTLSTHVLDTALGEPAADVPVRLDRHSDGEWVAVAKAVTDADGRVADWVPPHQWSVGRYRLVFDTAGYLGPGSFLPEVTVVFAVADPGRHLHLPLLLGPYGYTTYRGS